MFQFQRMKKYPLAISSRLENIGQMLQDLQDFEVAIEKEDIPEIYRIYNGRLHKQLKKHQIKIMRLTNYSRKFHDNFTQTS